MTDQELKELAASNTLNIKKLEVIQAETSKEVKETSKEVKETSKVLKALGLNVDGINKSTGQETEEFFYSSLKRNPCLGKIKFDFIDANVCRSRDGDEHEMDVFLENGDSVGIVETKNKVKKDHLAQLDNIIANFPLFHPSLKDYKIYGAIAGKIFPKHLQTLALKKGYYVLTQQGDHVEQHIPY